MNAKEKKAFVARMKKGRAAALKQKKKGYTGKHAFKGVMNGGKKSVSRLKINQLEARINQLEQIIKQNPRGEHIDIQHGAVTGEHARLSAELKQELDREANN